MDGAPFQNYKQTGLVNNGVDIGNRALGRGLSACFGNNGFYRCRFRLNDSRFCDDFSHRLLYSLRGFDCDLWSRLWRYFYAAAWSLCFRGGGGRCDVCALCFCINELFWFLSGHWLGKILVWQMVASIGCNHPQRER
jgi:hypothetical protein